MKGGDLIKGFYNFDIWNLINLKKIDSNTFFSEVGDPFLYTTFNFNIKDADSIVIEMKVK